MQLCHFQPVSFGVGSLPQRRRRGIIPASAILNHQDQRQQLIISGSSCDEVVDQLARRASRLAETCTPGTKAIICVAGGPGSGKTTTAALVCARINGTSSSGPTAVAVVVPMDGFHFSRRELDQMPNPQEAHARRGAHWTFDALSLVKCVKEIRAVGAAVVPSFDHAVGDPVAGDIRVLPEHKIVLLEGNYLLLDSAPWSELRPLCDDCWFVDAPLEVAMRRVFQRQTAIGMHPDVSLARIAGNDQLNFELVAATRASANVVVPSTLPLGEQPGEG